MNKIQNMTTQLRPEEQKNLQQSCDAVGIIIGHSASMQKLLTETFRVAKTHLPVLITGPTGSGKELIARLIQHLSLASSSPFIDVNCAAIPESLIESQFFGHTKGAFSGASNKQNGYFAMASDGILFLDEIAELPLLQQSKLLRVVESGQYRPLGEIQNLHFKGRIIAATHNDLEDNVKKQLFREDLYHRLNVLTLHVPALNERLGDVPALVQHFANKHSPSIQFCPQALQSIAKASWPGNIRELRNTIDRILVISACDYIDQNLLNQFISPAVNQTDDNPISQLDKLASSLIDLPIPIKLSAIEFATINAAMSKANDNKSSAARVLGVHRKFIERKLKNYDDIFSKINNLYYNTNLQMEVDDYKGAVTGLRQALTLIEGYPHLWQDDNKQLELILRLSICLRNTHGWHSSEMVALYSDADKLTSELNIPEERIVVQFSLWANKLMQLDLEGALDSAQSYYNEGSRLNNPNVMAHASISLANTYFWMGDYKNNADYLQRFFDIYRHDQRIIISSENDLFVYYLLLKSPYEFQVGKVSQAIESMDELLNYTHKIDCSFSLATAIQGAILLNFKLGELNKCYQLSEQLLQIATKHAFVFFQGFAEIFLGHQIGMQGYYQQAKKQITTAFTKKLNGGEGLLLNSIYGIILADISIYSDQLTHGIVNIEKSIAVSQEKNEHCYLPEQLVMRGRLKLLLNKHDNAYQDFIDANIKARNMGSLAGELKASYQLAKLYCLQKKPFEAQSALSSIILHYDESDRYADLISARKLLASL